MLVPPIKSVNPINSDNFKHINCINSSSKIAINPTKSVSSYDTIIYNLYDHPEYHAEVIKLLYDNWPDCFHELGIYSCEYAILDSIKCLVKHGYPMKLIMVRNDTYELIGCIGLDSRDMKEDNPYVRDGYPWIVDVYVKSTYRGKGYGKILVNHMISLVKSWKIYTKLYLWTSDQVKFYESMDWKVIDIICHRSVKYSVMLYEL